MQQHVEHGRREGQGREREVARVVPDDDLVAREVGAVAHQGEDATLLDHGDG